MVGTLLNGTLNAGIGGTTKDSQENDHCLCRRDLRLIADVEFFRQQSNQTKLDNNTGICAFLKEPSV